MDIERGAGAKEDGVGLLHFSGREQTETFIEAKVEMLGLGSRKRDKIVPDAVTAETAVQSPIIALHWMCQNQLHFC